ncbi:MULTISPECIES: hypothetical protein [unclassified Thiocapsa]|uniref:hypothetical protein n=1 Tax=unclassified Thiocapsa TaxID=2641286 RepID=UPI0035B25DB3
MPMLDLTLTLIDDVVASERPATEGGHTTLDYLPGAMLLGASAARLYKDLPRSDSFILFHSGKVRFGDAVPLSDALPGWPMPLCWHENKLRPAQDGHRLVAERLRNLQFGGFAENVQPKQLRDGYVRTDGCRVTVEKALRMKTAIDPDTGRVDEAKLFGYEAILAGQRFTARVEADDDVPAMLWEALVSALTCSDALLMGRSRSAEYGRVRAEWDPHVSALPPLEQPTPLGTLTLWCLSDLALLDERAQPSLKPTPARLGLRRGTLDWTRSFLRFRRFAAWNAYRHSYDLERQVIRRGSVITIEGIDPPLTDAERQHLQAGIGIYREIGLGRVAVAPALLSAAVPVFDTLPHTETTVRESVERPDHPLIDWLQGSQQLGAERRMAEKQARVLALQLERRYQLARAFSGLAVNLPVGPSPAQWGTVYEQARVATDLAKLRGSLFDGGNAVCKPKGEGWQDQFRDESVILTFADWFQAASVELNSLHAFRAFGREAQRAAKQVGGRDQRLEGTR